MSFPVVGPKEDRSEDEGDVDVSAFLRPLTHFVAVAAYRPDSQTRSPSFSQVPPFRCEVAILALTGPLLLLVCGLLHFSPSEALKLMPT